MADRDKEAEFEDQVKRFLEVYKILSPQARVSFEIEIAKKTSLMDDRTRKLYAALVDSAREALGAEDAITNMKKVK